MIATRCIPVVVWCLGIAMLPAAAGAHVTATGLAVLAVTDREVSYRLTVVPSELPEAAAQLLTRAMAGSRPDAERLAEAMRRAVAVSVDGVPCRPGRIAVQDVGAGIKALLDYALHCPAAPSRLEIEEDWANLFGAHYVSIVTNREPPPSGAPRGGLRECARCAYAHLRVGWVRTDETRASAGGLHSLLVR